MRQLIVVSAALTAASQAVQGQEPTLRPEIRPCVGASIPAGVQRDLFKGAPMFGRQAALEQRPSVHLLGTFAWGTYLGERGEASLYYDHRRDSLQGGIAAFRAAGFVGSVGAYADVLVAPRLAIRAQFDLGSSYLATVGFRFQGGPR